jgi:hypothetical protein
MSESVRASAGLEPEPPTAAEPAARRSRRRLGLSVVAEGRSGAAGVSQLARLAGRLDLAGVWWREPPLTGSPAVDLPALLDVLRSESADAPAGLIADFRDIPAVAELSIAYRTIGGLPIRLAVCGQWPLAEPWPGHLAELRDALGGDLALPPAEETGSAPAGGRPPAPPDTTGSASPGGRPPAPPNTTGLVAMAAAAAIFVAVRPDRDLDAELAGAAEAAAGRPVLVEVPVSVGRTSTEARARADGEELFAATGHPGEQGLFGTLEECQATAARLLHAGATELVCYLPRSHDLPDVLAQLRAISAGASALRPGEPPSAPPPPPAGWGGRRPAAG